MDEINIIRIPKEKAERLLQETSYGTRRNTIRWYLIKQNPLSNDEEFNTKIRWMAVVFSPIDETSNNPVLVIARHDQKDEKPYNFDIYPLFIDDNRNIFRFEKPIKQFRWHHAEDAVLNMFKKIPEYFFGLCAEVLTAQKLEGD